MPVSEQWRTEIQCHPVCSRDIVIKDYQRNRIFFLFSLFYYPFLNRFLTRDPLEQVQFDEHTKQQYLMIAAASSSSTLKTVLFVKNNFLPGPTGHSSHSIALENANNNNSNSSSNSNDSNSYKYILSPPINDHYQNNDFFLFASNRTMFAALPFDYSFSNLSSSVVVTSSSSSPSMLISSLIGIILFTITIWTILGNILVILAFVTDKQVRQGGMSNYLIINLAVSDLLLGIAILPFSASYSTFGIWYFGRFLCEMWLAIDVLCSTASIWGLLMIAFDRYIATNYPIRYRHHRNSISVALSYICVAWFVSLAISLLPVLFFEKKTPVFLSTTNRTIYVSPTKYNSTTRQCELYKDLKFVVISSLLSFYIPLVIMIFLYVKVLYAIRQQSLKMNKKQTSFVVRQLSTPKKRSNRKNKTTTSDRDQNAIDSPLSLHRSSSKFSILRRFFNSSNSDSTPTSDQHPPPIGCSYAQLFRKQHPSASFSQSSMTNDDMTPCDQQQLRRREITAEARVTRSLAVVIGCFICCWLPFFTLYIIRAVCLCLSFNAIEFFVWLGYSNSSINPVLYAILNKNFRLAFKNILLSVKKVVLI